MNRRNLLQAVGAAALLRGSPAFAFGGAAKAAPVVTPFALDEGRILIAAFVNAAGPYLFALDTGAPFNLIFDQVARELRMQVSVDVRIAGIGGKSEYPWYSAGEVRIGAMRLKDVGFGGIGSRLSKSAVGTFGAGLLTTFDSELDFHRGEWRLYPDGPAPREGYRKLPSRFVGHGSQASKLMVEASLDAFAGEFILDTGAPGEALLSSRASARSGLWNDARPYAPTRARGLGRGAALPGRFVRAGALRVGPFVFERPLVKLIQPGSALDDLEGDGLLGLAAIRHLSLSVDTRGEAAWGMPSEIDVPAPDYPLSGLWLDDAPGGVAVTDVGTGSPAAEAGVRKGDLIVGETLPALIHRITQPAGSAVAFEIGGNGERRRVSFTLRDFL